MFKQYAIGDRSPKLSLYGHALVVMEETNQLLIMGGNTSLMFGGYLKDIWMCDVIKMQWTKLENACMPYKMFNFGYVTVKNKKYGHHVIIFGGKCGGKNSDEIWFLNLDNWKWTKSQSKCPKKAMYYAVKTELNDSEIHLFEIDKKGHWKMKLSDILPSILHKKSQHTMPYISNSASDIDMSIMTNLKSSLVQEKKRTRALTRDNEERIKSMKEQKEKIDDIENENSSLRQENERIKADFEKLQNELNETQTKLSAATEQNIELKQKYEILLEHEKKRALGDTANYKHWDYEDCIYWICYLEAGRFEKYKESFLKNMKLENINGGHLIDLDKNDLHRLGCTDYGDKVALANHLQSLKE